MHPIFVSPHPPAALCSDACLQPRTFSCFQSSGSPAPIPFLCSHSCCSPTGDGAAEGGLLRVFLPGRKLPPPSVLETCNTAKLVLKDGLLPKFLGDRPALKCNKEGKSRLLLPRSFPEHCALMGERKEGKNNCSVHELFEKGWLCRS